MPSARYLCCLCCLGLLLVAACASPPPTFLTYENGDPALILRFQAADPEASPDELEALVADTLRSMASDAGTLALLRDLFSGYPVAVELCPVPYAAPRKPGLEAFEQAMMAPPPPEADFVLRVVDPERGSYSPFPDISGSVGGAAEIRTLPCAAVIAAGPVDVHIEAPKDRQTDDWSLMLEGLGVVTSIRRRSLEFAVQDYLLRHPPARWRTTMTRELLDRRMAEYRARLRLETKWERATE